MGEECWKMLSSEHDSHCIHELTVMWLLTEDRCKTILITILLWVGEGSMRLHLSFRSYGQLMVVVVIDTAKLALLK